MNLAARNLIEDRNLIIIVFCFFSVETKDSVVLKNSCHLSDLSQTETYVQFKLGKEDFKTTRKREFVLNIYNCQTELQG